MALEKESAYKGDEEIAKTEPIFEYEPYTQKEINWIWFKVDLRVVTPLAIIYLLQYMDKSNIGNAKVAGLEEQLNITSDQYTWVLSIFYFSYGLFEIPSNMLLKKIRPSLWLCGLCVAFGSNLALMGLCTNYSGLLAARFFLGVTTAGVYPGAAYYFSIWYPRDKLAFRFSLFFASASLAGSFSGLISAGIANMAGVHGREGWSWIFIIMGCIAVAGGFILYPLMPDYPESCKFLDEREKDLVMNVSRREQGQATEKGSDGSLKREEVIAAFKDWQTWSFCLQYFCYCTPCFSLAIFVPAVVQGLGYSGTQAQLMSVPPFAIAVPFIISTAWISDKYKRRAPIILSGFTVGLIGWIVLVTTSSSNARYGALIVASIGHWIIPGVGSMACSNSIAPNGKRAVTIGIVMGIGNLCGIITAQVFRSSDAPRYLPGLHAMMFFASLGIVQTIILWIVYSRINAARAKEWAANSHKYTEEELLALGDRAPNFKYLYP